MKRVAMSAAVVVLAACGQSSEPAAEAEAAPAVAYEGPAPGHYTVERTEDGSTSLSTMVINQDQTYVTTMGDGTKISGSFVHRDGMDCFDPEGEEGETCWTRTDGEDGAFAATSADGAVTVEVTPQ